MQQHICLAFTIVIYGILRVSMKMVDSWHFQEYCVSVYGQYHSICVDFDFDFYLWYNNLMGVGFGPIFSIHVFFTGLLCVAFATVLIMNQL